MSPSASPPPAVAPSVAPPGFVPASFAELAARADPAVVFVKTFQMNRGFGGRQHVDMGLGSAFVYDPAGYILTNNHVIENAQAIRVIFGRTREMDATVVGRDPPTDVAVLRVAATGLKALPFGDSDSVRVGDWVVAIGNPFGLSHTVSAGILSARHRTTQDVDGLDNSGYYDFLQTDASINPGNSGGPLLDIGGRVVGVNTAIRARANSIGFAIPINLIKEILPLLLKDGKVRRSAIGVKVVALLPEDLARLRLTSAEGALVSEVIPGGPAERAGLAPDDVILGFQGKPILGPEPLRWMASLAGVGKTITLRVARAQRVFDLKIKAGELTTNAKPIEGEPFQ